MNGRLKYELVCRKRVLCAGLCSLSLLWDILSLFGCSEGTLNWLMVVRNGA